MSLEDFVETVAEHKTPILIGLCGVVIAANMALGGSQQLKQKFARDAVDSSAKDAQARAETIYQEQGCISQALSNRTKTSNFTVGDYAVDPMSISPQNPGGTVINSGYLCSTDGSLFMISNGVVSQLIGTSPKIRQSLVTTGFSGEAVRMKERAKRLYQP